LRDLRAEPAKWEALQNLLTSDAQDLDPDLISQMHDACRTADLQKITRLTGINRALLFAHSVPKPKKRSLFQESSDPPEKQCWPLHQLFDVYEKSNPEAVQACLLALIKLLDDQPEEGLALASLLHPDSDGDLPLQSALKKTRRKNLIILPTLLHLMAWMGDSLDSLKKPLSGFAAESLSPLLNACIVQNKPDWFDTVLVWRSKINCGSPYPLEVAIQQGSADFVRHVLRKGANPDARTKADLLPLLALAAQTGNREIVKILLENDANPDATMPKGYESLRSLPLVAEVVGEIAALAAEEAQQTERARRARSDKPSSPYSPALFGYSVASPFELTKPISLLIESYLGLEAPNELEKVRLTSGALPFLGYELHRSALLPVLLRYISENKQDEAKSMMDSNSELLLMSGSVTDLSGRSFHKITPFQYALWLMRWQMWEMMRPHLGDEEAHRQFQELETYSTDHGRCFKFLGIKRALITLNDPLSLWGKDERVAREEKNRYFVETFGREQLFLPVWVIQRICQKGIAFNFDRISDFLNEKPSPTPPTMAFKYPYSSDKSDEWFVKDESGNKLGRIFAIIRDDHHEPIAHEYCFGREMIGIGDLTAIIVFENVCLEKRQALAAELNVVTAAERARKEMKKPAAPGDGLAAAAEVLGERSELPSHRFCSIM
jgi:hypothetical protein